MNKKLGVSIVVGIILFSIIFGIVGIIYTSFNNVYAANKRDDFTFAIDSTTGKVKVYDDLLIQEEYGFNMVLPQGLTMQNVTLYEKDNAGLLEISKDSNNNPTVIGRKIGKGTLCAKITYQGKVYETSTSFAVIKKDFCFPIVSKQVKEFSGKNAIVINKETELNLTLPSGYSLKDVELYEEGNTGLLNIDDSKKVVSGKNVGKGKLVAHLVGTDKYTVAEFEVIENTNTTKVPSKDLDADDEYKSSSSNSSNSSKTANKSLSFKNESRIVTYSSGILTIAETPSTKGIKLSDVSYSVSDSSIAEVTTNKQTYGAVVKIKSAGRVELIASYNNGELVAKKQLIIHSKVLDIYQSEKNSKINDTTVSLSVGESLNIVVKEGNNVISNNDLTFTTTNGKTCSIDEDGKVVAKTKGTVTIKAKLKENNNSYGQIKVNVLASAEEKLLNEEFSFPKDEKTGKVIEATKENGLIVGKTYTYDLIRPNGTQNYEVTYKCNTKDLLKIEGEEITPLKAGKGKLIATIQIAGKTKTASMNFEVFASEQDKTDSNLKDVKYINVNFNKDSLVVEKGNSITLKPVIDTNMKKSEYKLNWTTSNELVAKVDSNGRLTPVSVGTTYVTVGVDNYSSIHSTMKVEVKEKVVLVSSLKLNMPNLEKKGGVYLIKTNETNVMNFEVSPKNATNQDYSIEVDDKENFIVQGKNVIALKEGVKTKLTATSLDSGNKSVSITLQSIISDEDLSNLQLITDNTIVTIKVGETLKFKNVENATVTKAGNNFMYTLDNNLLSITGNKIGESTIIIKNGNKRIEIPVNVVAEQLKEDDIPVSKIEVVKDSKTSQTKDFSVDNPLVVNKYYNVASAVDIYPSNATNKDLNVEVSDKEAFTVTADGNLVANKENANAIVTLSSVSNPEVKTSFKVSSVASKIVSIKFAKDYVGENDLTTESTWGFNLYITLDNGYTFDPVANPNVETNEEYIKYKNQIKFQSSDTSLLRINSENCAEVVKGKNGKGIIKAYVASDPSVSAQALFETVGITTESNIKTASFAKNEYTFSFDEGSIVFLPIITLENNKTFDPSLDYAKVDSVAKTDEYINYKSQLELVVVDGNSNIVSIDDSNEEELKIFAKAIGECTIGLRKKGENTVLSKTKILVVEKDPDYVKSDSNLVANITEVNHATTTRNKNLNITNIQFAKKSYELTDSWAVEFHPILTLSDGTNLDENSEDNDIYLYYLGLTQIYLTNDSNNKDIDFGIIEVINSKVPYQVVPLKNGTVKLAVGLKSSGITYDVVPITVKI